jgi:methylenetetrahydrofolate dehydrogenase (NADP+)/methenyltetrahydrofolate cyclohydrolase/formyltetrahydrofolate synthetase
MIRRAPSFRSAQPHRSHPRPKAITLLPRPLHARTALISLSPISGSAWPGLAARQTVRPRGQNLPSGRSPLLTLPSIVAPRPSLAAQDVSQTRLFSTTPLAMTATKIDGTAIAKRIRERLHAEIENTQKTNPRYKPSLKIIQGNIHVLLILDRN